MSDTPALVAESRDALEPNEPGWYAYSGGRQLMVFHLRESGQWSAHFADGTAGDCAWGYIEQALSVWELVPLTTAEAHREQIAREIEKVPHTTGQVEPEYEDGYLTGREDAARIVRAALTPKDQPMTDIDEIMDAIENDSFYSDNAEEWTITITDVRRILQRFLGEIND